MTTALNQFWSAVPGWGIKEELRLYTSISLCWAFTSAQLSKLGFPLTVSLFLRNWGGLMIAQSSAQFHQRFPCCTVCLIWLALGVRQIPYGLPWCQKGSPYVRKVYHGVREVYRGCRKVNQCVRKVYHPPILKSPDQPTDLPTNEQWRTNNKQQTSNKQHLKYRAAPDFQSRGEFEIWSLAIFKVISIADIPHFLLY